MKQPTTSKGITHETIALLDAAIPCSVKKADRRRIIEIQIALARIGRPVPGGPVAALERQLSYLADHGFPPEAMIPMFAHLLPKQVA